MSRGLSKQQRRIFSMLKTKLLVNSDRGYFSTQEVVTEFNFDYKIWLVEVERNPFLSSRKSHIDYKKFDKIRMSMYRALRSLEKRGLIVSFKQRNERCWAVPERLKERRLGTIVFHEMDWVRQDKEYREADSECWKWGAFIRTLPKDLHLEYKLRILTEENWSRIKKLWKKYRAFSGSRV